MEHTLERIGTVMRGLALVLAGVLLLHFSVGCRDRRHAEIPEEGERVVYDDGEYIMVQGKTVRRPSPNKGFQYVLIPLTLRNGGDTSIIFSTQVCVSAYAVPSGTDCMTAHREAAAFGRENVRDFRTFDGIIYGNRDTAAWLAFEVPEGSQSVHVDFYTGYRDGKCLSFDCRI